MLQKRLRPVSSQTLDVFMSRTKEFRNKAMMSNMYPGCSFSVETPPRESVIGCKKGKPCFFYLYSRTSNSSCPRLITHDEFSGIFKPTFDSGLCRYEIVYKNTTSVGENMLCLRLCAGGESRCFQMYTNDIVDQCEPNPCTNNGYCQTLPTGSFKCHCKKGYWGNYCEKGLCASKSTCQNDAACYINYNNTECRCRYGYLGSDCRNQSNMVLTNTVENGGHFTQLNRIEILTCYIKGKCYIPLFMLKNVNQMPRIEQGFCDKTLELQNLEFLQPEGGIVQGTLSVIGHELGVKKMCLDSVATPRTSRIEDEICFLINVTEGNCCFIITSSLVVKINRIVPYFIKPTLPNAAVIQCYTGEQCHLRLWAKNKIGMKNCPMLDVDKNIEDGVYVFPLKNADQEPCVFETSINSENATDTNLCFSLKSAALLNAYENVFHEKRCYTIRFLQKLEALDSCAGKSCYNEGFCDSSYSPSQCLCRSGFFGENCSIEVGHPQGIDTSLTNQPIFGDVALPKRVICPLLEECVVPFSVTYNSDTFSVSWNGSNVNNVTIEHHQIAGSHDYRVKASLLHNVTGDDEFCLSLISPDGKTYDAICCNVTSKSTSTDKSQEIFQAYFISPSPNTESEFTCTPGQSCHVPISTSKEYNRNCPKVQSRSALPVHIFASLSSTDQECHHDVTILSNKSFTGSKEYCFQTSLSGIAGEERCIKIHFDPHVLPPPTAVLPELTTATSISTTVADVTTPATSTSTTTEDITMTAATATEATQPTGANEGPRSTTKSTTAEDVTTTATSTSTTGVDVTTPATSKSTTAVDVTTTETSKSISTVEINTREILKSTTAADVTTAATSTSTTALDVTTTATTATEATKPTGANEGPNSTTTTNATNSVEPSDNTCGVLKEKEKAVKGRFECYCVHPVTGLNTKLSPLVSMERLLIAAGMGSGAMIITLGLAALLYRLSQKCLAPHNQEDKRRALSKRKITPESMLSKKAKERKHNKMAVLV
ncbi:uncharacterized protein LOC111128400 [Crassostrea virginica]